MKLSNFKRLPNQIELNVSSTPHSNFLRSWVRLNFISYSLLEHMHGWFIKDSDSKLDPAETNARDIKEYVSTKWMNKKQINIKFDPIGAYFKNLQKKTKK